MVKGTIMYVGGFELPDKNAAAHRVLGNAKALKKNGYNIIFVDLSKDTKESVCRNFDSYKIYSKKYPKTYFQWFKHLNSINLEKKILNSYKDIKIVICYNTPSIILFRLIILCRSKNIKIVSDVTEWYESKRLIKKIDTFLRMTYLNKRVDGVICISSYLHGYYHEFVESIIVPPLIDYEDKKWSREHQINKNKHVQLIYSGQPGVHKDNLNKVIETLFNVKDSVVINFSIIGISKERYLKQYPLQAMIIKDLNDRIDFIGRLDHKKSLRLIKQSDFHIFIRQINRVNNAGFPTKFVESMACGTPVITTNISDLHEYLIEGKNGFFVEYDSNDKLEELLNKIDTLNEDELNRMKSYCLKMKDFDYNKYIGVFNVFINKIIEKR